jgi:hypothetical protein
MASAFYKSAFYYDSTDCVNGEGLAKVECIGKAI